MGQKSSKTISYEELEKHVEYLTKHKETLTSQREQLLSKNNQFLVEINKLNNDIVKLNNKNKQLEHLSIKNIDDDQIKLGIKKILENPETNCQLLPDNIESTLYENCIKLFIKNYS